MTFSQEKELFPEILFYLGAILLYGPSLVAQSEESAFNAGDQSLIPRSVISTGKEMATHSISTCVHGQREAGGLHSMRLQRDITSNLSSNLMLLFMAGQMSNY